jgi:hypothetical protein
MLENTEAGKAIKTGPSIETGNMSRYTRRRQTKHNTTQCNMFWSLQYTNKQTKNVNKTFMSPPTNNCK